MKTPRQQLGWGSAAALLSGATLWSGTGLAPEWWLTWGAAWAGGGLNLWHYYRSTLGVPLPVALAAVTLPAIAFAALVVLMRSRESAPDRVLEA
jgi:hypothetical protein